MDINKYNWSELTSIDDIDKKVENFNKNLLDCINKHAPLNKISYRNLPTLCLTDEIKWGKGSEKFGEEIKMRSLKNLFFSQIRITGSITWWIEYWFCLLY